MSIFWGSTEAGSVQMNCCHAFAFGAAVFSGRATPSEPASCSSFPLPFTDAAAGEACWQFEFTLTLAAATAAAGAATFESPSWFPRKPAGCSNFVLTFSAAAVAVGTEISESPSWFPGKPAAASAADGAGLSESPSWFPGKPAGCLSFSLALL